MQARGKADELESNMRFCPLRRVRCEGETVACSSLEAKAEIAEAVATALRGNFFDL